MTTRRHYFTSYESKRPSSDKIKEKRQLPNAKITMRRATTTVSLMALCLVVASFEITRPPASYAQDATQMHYFGVARNLLEEEEAKRLKGNYQEICSVAIEFNRALRPYPDAKGFTSVLKGWRLFYYNQQEFSVLVAKMKSMCPSGYYFR